MKDIIKLLISIIVCQGAGFVGSIFTTPNIPVWYATLKKPSITPPNWLFAPVWTILFLLMGISAYLVWRYDLANPRVRIALIIFIIQLIVNISWSLVFFGLKSPSAGFFVIIALWLLILLTIIHFTNISIAAGILLIPYILWVSFASVLNFMLWQLNP
ncbi:MAG: tryptophan-rich sensory protein [candidate division WOR-3 bacterium]|nr:tryptophan-rich sensory protein [candidate division WOR-3 bacterium]